MKRSNTAGPVCLAFLLLFSYPVLATGSSGPALPIIPYPQEVEVVDRDFRMGSKVHIQIDRHASSEDQFAAAALVTSLKEEHGVEASITRVPSTSAIVLTRHSGGQRLKPEGYRLTSSEKGVTISAGSAAGLFYGTQTLLQLIRHGNGSLFIPGLRIVDWPDIRERAIHYDTKHHQDKKEYVERFIRDLARFKINMLVWEWEDKLAYTSHPDIGAPGAFTLAEMQELTRYARQYHIELVPLVQGLGHASFILKWPQYAHLREVASSNWEFCPLKEESYQLLFDLWEEAIKATPGSRYIHIGSDETYELAACDACRAKAEEIGASGVYTLFINRAAKHLQALGRRVMAWERPMGWQESSSPAVGITPAKGLVLTESYDYETPDFQHARKARTLGYEVFAYDPNPGIEHIFLPYYYRERRGEITEGSFEQSCRFLSAASQSGAFDGIISTSWDDSGLHNQVWMLRFATAAARSWNGKAPTPEETRTSFFINYYGPNATNIEELFRLFNEGAYYYMSTLERNVWHHGVIGKTHLPDLPRGDAIEYDPYWNKEYSDMVKRSEEMAGVMQRALAIIDDNLKKTVRNAADFEVFRSMAQLIWHTTQTYADLSKLEQLITRAHRKHFENHADAYKSLEEAAKLLENTLKRRESIFRALVSTWEKTRLPKGLSTGDKQYFFRQDRARHFANRAPDMTYLIIDEQDLDIEGYLVRLKSYMKYYRQLHLDVP